MEHDTVDIAPVVAEAVRRGILTIGVGDHGNEIGFGAIREAVTLAMPQGGTLCDTTTTDLVVPAMMSNWGCYGIEAALACLLGAASLLHSPAQEERIIRACLDAGGVEAMFTSTDFMVDGLDWTGRLPWPSCRACTHSSATSSASPWKLGQPGWRIERLRRHGFPDKRSSLANPDENDGQAPPRDGCDKIDRSRVLSWRVLNN